jgi:transcriptional regulator with XRE-family HTH domain
MTRMPRRTLAEVIATEIRAEMTRQRISQRQLGEQLGWTQSRVSRRLLGQKPLEVDDVQRIAGALGVSMEQLGWPAAPAKPRRAS